MTGFCQTGAWESTSAQRILAPVNRYLTRVTGLPYSCPMAKKQHNDRAVRELFDELIALGCTIERKKNGGFVIRPPKGAENQTPYFTHGTAKSVLPMRRDFRKNYGLPV